MISVLIEGWRHVSHSYALVAQSLALAALKDQEIQLYFRDLPLIGKWQGRSDVFSASEERQLRAIPAPSPGQVFDACLRIGYPYATHLCQEARHTWVFITCEFTELQPGFFRSAEDLQRLLQTQELQVSTPSNWSKRGIANSGVAPQRIHLLAHGVDNSVFFPQPQLMQATRQQLGLQPEHFVFFNVCGAASPNKGLPELLGAFAALTASYPQTRLLIKVSGELYASPVEKINQYLLALPVQMQDLLRQRLLVIENPLSSQDMAKLYCASDAYVSAYHAEAFNMPVLEAIACGLPVICTANGPTDDFTRPEFARRISAQEHVASVEVDGKTVRSGSLMPDFDHLLSLLEEVVQDQRLAQQAKQAGPTFVAVEYSWTQICQRFKMQVQSLLS